MTDYIYPRGPGFVMEDYTREEALASVGPGWSKIVGHLWDWCKMQSFPIEIHQVKEKFGTLRFYIGGVPEEEYDTVYAAIGGAERMTGITCEDCGLPGNLTAGGYSGGYVKTLCPPHAKEWVDKKGIVSPHFFGER